jgi:hypothetical protein
MFISLTSGFDGSEVETVEVKMRADFCFLSSFIHLLVSEFIFQAICENKFLFTAHFKLNSIAQNNVAILILLSTFSCDL